MSKAESRPRLTAARKFELYLATRSATAPLGELLRHYGVHLDDLRAVERAALAGLKGHGHHGDQPTDISPARVQSLEQELAEKTHALAELSVSYTLLEKKIERIASLYIGQRLTSSEQHVIRDLIAEAQVHGLTTQQACAMIGLSPRTLQRWQAADRALTPPPTCAVPSAVATSQGLYSRPYNALTAREVALVVALIQSPLHADASCRELALALEQGPSPLYVSPVTIGEYQCALNCNGPRGRQGGQGRHRTAPDTDWVNGPNQLWDWDITYLHSPERNVFFYLYSLLDHWSRKNIAGLIESQLSSACAQTLWDHGLINEHLLDQPAST